MLDIGWTELLVIGIVALIVVGPKDLPLMFRALGRFTGQARRMAREFTRAMGEAADEAGVKDVQRDLRSMTNPSQMGMDALKDATDFGGWSEEDLDKASGSGKAARPAAKPSDTAGPETRKLAEKQAARAAERRERHPAPDAPGGTDDSAA